MGCGLGDIKMKLIYKGKFDGKIESLPHGEHVLGAVKFKEADSPETLAKRINILAVILLIILYLVSSVVSGSRYNGWGILASLLTLFPHEILHAVCFRETVYLYLYLSKGMAFVVGPEHMSKGRFILMSMLPNLVFGFLPYVIFLFLPRCTFLGTMGQFCIVMGMGDYYNVFHALTQMPRGARTYLYQFNSYWYMPEQ